MMGGLAFPVIGSPLLLLSPRRERAESRERERPRIWATSLARITVTPPPPLKEKFWRHERESRECGGGDINLEKNKCQGPVSTRTTGQGPCPVRNLFARASHTSTNNVVSRSIRTSKGPIEGGQDNVKLNLLWQLNIIHFSSTYKTVHLRVQAATRSFM